MSSEKRGVDLSVKLGNLVLPNPVMVASGTFGYGTEYADLYPPERLGAVVTKAITVLPRDGNPPPRLWETEAGLLNSVGLANCGLDVFVQDKMPILRSRGVRVVANVAGVREEEFVELATVLDRTEGVHALELNLSCPNVAAGGMALGVEPGTVCSVVTAVRAATDLPLLVKLPPQTHLLTDIAEAVHAEGGDAVTLVNTLPAMDVDPITRRPRLGNVTGGLSGPALRPVALAAVWRTRQRCKVPIVGVGGIATSLDAVAFLLCGASAVQIGTGLFGDPLLPIRVLEGIEGYCAERGVRRVTELVGALRLPE